MFGLGGIRLRGPDKKYIRDEAHVEDYKNAPAVGRVRFGELCFYYRDLGVKYYVPYDYIERAFIRISETQPDDSPPIYYYRLILVHDGKEFANLIFNKEPEADEALEKLSERAPNMAVGYIPPPGGKKASFR
ncbi:MAG: hypothetical protein IJP64_02970 [Oscillospiraceae bacterium]|nr:hypothetical protein [Oscillospiraceae bacterium]